MSPCFSCLKSLALKSFVVIGLMIIYSCSEPEVVVAPEKPTPPTPNPTEPLPEVLCAPQVIEGYCNRISYFPGDRLTAFIHSKEDISSCKLTVYDLSGKAVFSVASPMMIQQKSTQEPYKNGYGYVPTIEIILPANLASGIYQIEKKIPFIVKPSGVVDLLVVYPSNTINAYSTSGGKNLYSPDHPSAVSFHRPLGLQSFSMECLKWLTTLKDISIGYVADGDLDVYQSMAKGKILVIVGHSEYWTRPARLNFDQFVDKGNHAIILSGNTMWWQVRYSDDEDQSQMTCYKNVDLDPIADPLFKTFLWNDFSLQYPIVASIGADFDLGGYGQKTDNGWNGYRITRPGSPLFEGTNLSKGDILSCPTVEYDGAPIISWVNGDPLPDLTSMNVFKAEIIGFDKGFRSKETYGTLVVLKRNPSAGIIINTGSTDWCSTAGMGGSSGQEIKRITLNAIHKLLNGEEVFSE